MPIHASNTEAVVSASSDDTCDVSSVALIIEWISGVVDRVNAVVVFDVSVSIIIDSVTANLSRIRPHVGGEIGVVVAHAGVDHRDDNLRGL